MSSTSDFNKTLCKDDRLNVSSSINYSIFKGGQSIVASSVQCPAPSTSQLNFQVLVPSSTVILDRKILWRSTFVAAITATAPVGQNIINYGYSDSLAPYCAHQMLSSLSCTINNATITQNTQQILSAILRLGDKKSLNRYNSATPTAYDILNNYADGLGSNNNVLGSFQNANLDNDYVGRGAFVLDYIGTNVDCVTVAPMTPSTGAAQTVYVKFTVSEYIMMSPWLFGDVSDSAGIYGIQALSFNFNLAPTGQFQRFWRSAASFPQNVSLVRVDKSELLLEYISPHASDILNPKNVLPYYEMPSYKTPVNNLAAGSTTTVTASALQLSGIPDRLIIYVRKLISAQTSNDTDSFMTISNISCNWNNNAGLMSTYQPQQLYAISVENGYNGSYYEFSGRCNMVDNASGMGRVVPTSGSVCVIELGKDLQLNEEWSSPGLLGSFNLQLQLTIVNNTASVFSGEIVIVTMNSGVIVTQEGTTAVYTNIINRQDVLDASQTQPIFRSQALRMIGGGWWDSLKSVIGKVIPHAMPYVKNWMSNHESPYAQLGAKALTQFGYGKGNGKTGGRKLIDRLQE